MEKSVYLSLGRYDTPAEQSKYDHELRELASELNRGQEIEFDVEGLARLRRQRIELELVADVSVLRYLLRVLFPGLLILLAISAVLIILKLR